MIAATTNAAFPRLDKAEVELIRGLAPAQEFADGEIVFSAGDAEIDLFVVESGEIEIFNPSDGDRVIATHHAGEFSGDVDLLTGRPVIISGRAHGATRVLRLPGRKLRALLNRVPSVSEKLMIAFTLRRELLTQSGRLGLRVVGPAVCKDTNRIREFLYKNFVPFTWYDPATADGQKAWELLGSPRGWPIVECTGGQVLLQPSLRELANAAGVWRQCPTQEVDLAIVGAGPAGITAAVYAASEGLSTLVLDTLGPGGQAGGSSRIENFIGFPAGLSGAELAMRGVLQMLKFGARMVAPVSVERLVPAARPGEKHELTLDCGTHLHARVVLLATGVRWRRLPAQGAEKFESAGIHYACTGVEAELYDGSDVAVVGAGNSAGQAVMFLSECCPDRTVHMVIRKQLGPGMSSYLANRIRAAKNVVVHEGTEISAVHGNRRVEAVQLNPSDTAGASDNGRGGNGQGSNEQPNGGNASGENRVLPCIAVFVFIGADPAAEWLPETIARDKQGYLLTGTDVVRSGRWPLEDRDPCPLETTLPGVLAAGDIRSGSTKRVGFAVGDGSLAVTCVHRLLAAGG